MAHSISSSDEELPLMPKVPGGGVSEPIISPKEFIDSPVTVSKPDQIPRVNGNISELGSSEVLSSTPKNNRSSKRVISTPAEESSEDELIPTVTKGKSTPTRKKRSRELLEGKDEDLNTPSKKSAKTPKKKSTKKTAKPKKTWEMPGQKKDTPHELDGGRIFYESLRKQKPESKMAEEYMLRHGLLPRQEAQMLVDKMVKIKEDIKQKKAASSTKKTKSPKSPKKVTRRRRRSSKKTKSVLRMKAKDCKKAKKSRKGKNDTKVKSRRKRKKTLSEESSEDEPLMVKKR